MAAYEPAIAATAAPHAPWFIVPADNKWFTRLVVVAAMNEALDQLDLKFPKVDREARALDAARARGPAPAWRSSTIPSSHLRYFGPAGWVSADRVS